MRQDNQTIVNHFSEAVKEGENFFITGYAGLSSSELSDLRLALDKQQASHRVLKNTLFKRAVEAAGVSAENTLDGMLQGPSAFTIGGSDVVTVAKVIVDFSKECDKLQIKGGYVDGKVLDADAIQSLAKLPSRQELLAKVVGCVANPLNGMVNVLAANLRNLVGVLQSIKDKKESE